MNKTLNDIRTPTFKEYTFYHNSFLTPFQVKEDSSGHGIESIISQVESLLVQGSFAEAADALEGGVLIPTIVLFVLIPAITLMYTTKY